MRGGTGFRVKSGNRSEQGRFRIHFLAFKADFSRLLSEKANRLAEKTYFFSARRADGMRLPKKKAFENGDDARGKRLRFHYLERKGVQNRNVFL